MWDKNIFTLFIFPKDSNSRIKMAFGGSAYAGVVDL